jgi:NTE family protein
MMMTMKTLEVGLVLGGGGARGLAHIGVLRALEEYNIRPVALAGCSMGAIIGAFYAAGYGPDDMVEIIKKLKYRQFFYFGELGGIIGGAGIEAFLSQYLPETFEDLSLPLTVTTVDVQAGRLVVLNRGELISALRASSALPGIISPVKRYERYYVDGGLLNNLPIDVIRTMTMAPVIAVDVGAPPNKHLDFEPEKTSILAHVSDLVRGKKGLLDDVLRRGLTIELFMKAVDIPQKVLTEMRLSLQPPEVLIRPALEPQFGIEDFGRAKEAIKLGYSAAKTSLQDWLASLTPTPPEAQSDESDQRAQTGQHQPEDDRARHPANSRKN